MSSKTANMPIANATDQPVDLFRLQEMVGDDLHDLRDVVELYMHEADDLMLSLSEAVRAESLPEVQGLAHRLGGASAMCGMVGMIDPLARLERAGETSERNEKEGWLKEAARQKERIQAYLLDHGLRTAC